MGPSRPGAASSPARFHKALGLTLLVAVSVPWHRALAGRTTGPVADQVVRLGEAYAQAHWFGIALGATVVLVSGLLLRPSWFSALGRASTRWFLDPGPRVFGLLLAVIAVAFAGTFSVVGLDRGPVLIDGVSQLVHARFVAAGYLVGPALEDPAFWQVQFMLPTNAGWASQYPPGFIALLALGVLAGAAWMVGPLSFGVATYLTTLVADRLFPDDRVVARVGAGLTAVSPFLAFHAGAVMSHAPATAFIALAIYASFRAREGGVGWALTAGAAVGVAFATRPFAGFVLALVPAALLARDVQTAGAPRRSRPLRRLGVAVMGGLPAVVAVLLYNARVFGSPVRFGYEAAAGRSAGLGFHTDPWGSPYGPVQALVYTAADLAGVSLDLLLTPLPLVVIVAVHLLRADRLAFGTRVALWWALLPVAGNLFYWHHDLFMGPRMLYEAGPGWCLLIAASAVGLVRSLPAGGPGWGTLRWSARTGVVATFVLALAVGLGLAAPLKMGNHARQARVHGMARPAPRTDGASLVFVHEDWQSRLGARMAALDLPLDSIRRVLAEHSTCSVETWVRAREHGDGGGGPALRSVPRADLVERVMPSGSRIRTFEGETLGAVCEREASSDFAGVLPLAPFLWQGDLPGLGGEGAMFVRDLGPERNQRLLALYPERRPLLLRAVAGRPPDVVPYESGITRLWAVP